MLMLIVTFDDVQVNDADIDYGAFNHDGYEDADNDDIDYVYVGISDLIWRFF